MPNDLDTFDEELSGLQQAGEEILLIEISEDFFKKLMDGRPSAALNPESDHNEYQGIQVFITEDAEDYQFHLAMDDDEFDLIQ